MCNLHFIIINIIITINIFDDGQYLQNIIVQFALSAICGRPLDQGKQDVLTILTHNREEQDVKQRSNIGADASKVERMQSSDCRLFYLSWICAIVSWVGERGGAVYLLFPLLFHTISQGIVSFPDGQEEAHFIAEGGERGRTWTPRRLFKKHSSAITNSVACQRARKNLSARATREPPSSITCFLPKVIATAAR